MSLMKEFDALPEIGHACGHNLIAISTLGAALATKEWLEEDHTRAGTVKLFGTPVLPFLDVINLRVKKMEEGKLTSSTMGFTKILAFHSCVIQVSSTEDLSRL
jgi:hypothetical protein